ncbi:hypothetical protein SAMN05216270_1114 [Glycomyces harbinensis]|uniref:Uncharacterized protein n=1 Tax=Glycomyces harbinensis TaxID=58114 RepID=A0A1G6ZHE2_9ACTN|nr:hypothetical protein SAMN05216270_1114 [Glycomyces harbinensis]
MVGGERAVVEADDTQVSRHAPAGPVRGGQDAEREVVVAAQDRGDVRVGDQSERGLERRAHGPSGGDDGGRLDPGLVQRRGPAGLAAGLGGDGEVVDRGVAHVEQIPGGAGGDGAVVERDEPVGRGLLDAEVLAAGGDGGVRLGLLERLHGLGGGLVVGDDDGRGAVVREAGQDVGLGVGLVGVQDRDEDGESGGPGGVFDAAEGLGGAVEGGVGGEDGDRPQGAAGEGARRAVGPVAQLGDGGLHFRAGGVGDHRRVVDDPRDGLMGHPCALGHVEHADWSGFGCAHGGRSPLGSSAIRRWRSRRPPRPRPGRPSAPARPD